MSPKIHILLVATTERFLRRVYDIEEAIVVFFLLIDLHDGRRIGNHAAIIDKQEECLVGMEL